MNFVMTMVGPQGEKAGTEKLGVKTLRPRFGVVNRSPATNSILQTLETEKRAMYAGDIAAELDKSYQLVGKRSKTLAERGLVKRGTTQGRRTFQITDLGQTSYFSAATNDGLHVGPETDEDDGRMDASEDVEKPRN